MISLIDRYETVFTDGEVAVGKTDVIKMKIVLYNNVNQFVPSEKNQAGTARIIVQANRFIVAGWRDCSRCQPIG